LDIFNVINNAAYMEKCNSTEDSKYIMALDKIGFWDVYKEIKYRDTFLIIDKKGNINFFIKLNDLTNVKDLLGNNKISIYTNWNCHGPEIVLDINGLERVPGFIFELENNTDAFILKRFLENSEAYVQYIIQDEEGIIKLLTEKVQIDSNFTNRLKYYIELDFHDEYPRIKDKEIYEELGYYIKTYGDTKVLEEVLNVAVSLKTQSCDELITVHVEADDFYKIIFSGDILNIKTLIDEIAGKVNIIEEGRTEVGGKPFFQCNRGLLYFLK
jgi:hypothetical protein